MDVILRVAPRLWDQEMYTDECLRTKAGRCGRSTGEEREVGENQDTVQMTAGKKILEY